MRALAMPSYHHTSYPSAWLAGVAGFLYSVSFVLISKAAPGLGAGLSGLFLMLGGVLGASALIGLYVKLQPKSGGYALWALIFGVAGAVSATLHGGYDLANAIHAPSQAISPSPVDPRGLGTFGLSGISILAFAYLITKDATLPRNLGYLGYASGVLLVLIYVARLFILSTSNLLVLIPAGLEGFIVNPVWYVWLGFALRKEVVR